MKGERLLMTNAKLDNNLLQFQDRKDQNDILKRNVKIGLYFSDTVLIF